MISLFLSWYTVFFLLIVPNPSITKTPLNSPPDCRAKPGFIDRINGIDGKRAAISTTELNVNGLTLVELEQPQFPNSKRLKTYQHESWKMAGSVGPFTLDQFGNIYIVPSPKVNVLENPIKDQNIIYVVNSGTGIMEPLINLPYDSTLLTSNFRNPFGLIGITYDCEDFTLFASSVLGSTPEIEKGVIFHINPFNKKIISALKNIDAFGMIPIQMGNEKRLLYGLARTGDVYSVLLDNKGQFVGKPRKEFSLEGLGERGDDKVRKFKVNKEGDLEVYGLQFYYNLTAPTEKPESKYVFHYNSNAMTWSLSEK